MDAKRSELFDVRKRDGIYEVLTMIESPGGETWQPLATHFVTHRFLEAPRCLPGRLFPVLPVTIGDALRAEGWLTPWEAEDLRKRLEDARV